MKRILSLLFCLSSVLLVHGAQEQVVRLGNVVCNPGATLTVPVEVKGLQNVSSVSVLLTYDPLVLVHLKTEAGSLKDKLPKCLFFDEVGSVLIIAFGSADCETLTGQLAQVTFAVRDGSEGLYSDLSLAEVRINEKTMTADLTIDTALVPERGMLRSYAITATPQRLDEGALTIAPETTLKAIQLQDGDGLQVASAQQDPIVITESLTATGTLKVLPPTSGWVTATYPVLKCKTAGLTLVPEGEMKSVMISTVTTEDGYTLYSLATEVEGGLVVETENGISFTPDDKKVLTNLLGTVAEGVSKVVVKGAQEAVELGLDLGITPATSIAEGVLTANFVLPELQITAFDPVAGVVKAKVIPPSGATIQSKQSVTGVIHVYGSNSLADRMSKIASPKIELENYLKPESKGEVKMTVQFGSKTFFRVVAGRVTSETIDSPIQTKQERTKE